MTSFYLNYLFKDLSPHIVTFCSSGGWSLNIRIVGHTTQSITATAFSCCYHSYSHLHFLSASSPHSRKAYRPHSSQSDFSEVHIMLHHSCAENTTMATRIKSKCRHTEPIWPHPCITLWPPRLSNSHSTSATLALCCLHKHSNFVLRNFGCALFPAWKVLPIFHGWLFLVISSVDLSWCSS